MGAFPLSSWSSCRRGSTVTPLVNTLIICVIRGSVLYSKKNCRNFVRNLAPFVRIKFIPKSLNLQYLGKGEKIFCPKISRKLELLILKRKFWHKKRSMSPPCSKMNQRNTVFYLLALSIIFISSSDNP